MRVASYCLAMRSRPDRVFTSDERIQRVIDHPLRQVVQADGRIRRSAWIVDAEQRVLRVILLEDGETVHNAFFDRSFKK
jgi:hypothetical protein